MQATSRLELMSQRRSKSKTLNHFVHTYIIKPKVTVESKSEEKWSFNLADILMYTFICLLIITPFVLSVISQQDFIKNDNRDTLQKLELSNISRSFYVK